MIFFRSLQEVDHLLYFTFCFMQSSYICKLNTNIFVDIELLFLWPCTLPPHGSLWSSQNGSNDEDDEKHIQDVVDLIQNNFHSSPSDIFILDVPILDTVIQKFVEGQNFTIIPLISYFSCYLFEPYFFISEEFLLNKLHLFEGVHLEQLHKGLWSQLCLISEQVVNGVNAQDPEKDGRNPKLLIVHIFQFIHEILHYHFELLDQLHRFGCRFFIGIFWIWFLPKVIYKLIQLLFPAFLLLIFTFLLFLIALIFVLLLLFIVFVIFIIFLIAKCKRISLERTQGKVRTCNPLMVPSGCKVDQFICFSSLRKGERNNLGVCQLSNHVQLQMKMNMNINEQRRQQIKQRINHILQPLIIDLLIVKPQNQLTFMREWLEERREYFRIYQNQQGFKKTASKVGSGVSPTRK